MGRRFTQLFNQYLGNPQTDLDELQWIVVFPWYDAFSFCGTPEKTREAALKQVFPITFGRSGAMLVAFKASEWPHTALKVVQSYSLTGTETDFTVSPVDEGEKIFMFTNLESAVKGSE